MLTMLDAIMNRVSIRSYLDKPMAKVQTKQIQRIINQAPPGLFGNRVRFELIDLSELTKRQAQLLGDVPGISGAGMFIAGAVKRRAHCLEDFGYCLQHIVLRLTCQAFGTCWIGGQFPRDQYTRQIHTTREELLPAIIPLGLFQQKKNLSLQIMKLLTEKRERKSHGEIFFSNDLRTPLEPEEAGKFLPVLEAVRVAPSSWNSQPWVVIKAEKGNIFHFYRRSLELVPAVKGIDLNRVDLGIALCHFALALGELEIHGRWGRQAKGPEAGPGLHYLLSWQETAAGEL